MSPLRRAEPGALITAEDWNAVIAAIERLDERVTDLERAARQVAILGVEPSTVSPDETLSVSGRNFAVPAAQNVVMLGETRITSFLAGASGEQLDFVVPSVPDLPRSMPLTIGNAWGTAAVIVTVQPDKARPSGRLIVRLAANQHLGDRTLRPGEIVEVVWNVWSDTNVAETYAFELDFRSADGRSAVGPWRDGAALLDASGNPLTQARIAPSRPLTPLPGRLPAGLRPEVLQPSRPAVVPDVDIPGAGGFSGISGISGISDVGDMASGIRGGGIASGGIARSGLGGSIPTTTTAAALSGRSRREVDPGSVVGRIADVGERIRPGAVRPDIIGSGAFGGLADILGPGFRRPELVGPFQAHARIKAPASGRVYAVLRVSSTSAPDDPALSHEAELELQVEQRIRVPLPDVDFSPPLVRTPEGVRPLDRVEIEPGIGTHVTFPTELGAGLFEIDVRIEPDPGDWKIDEVTRPSGERLRVAEGAGTGVISAAGGSETLDVAVTAPERADDKERFLRVTARRADTGEVTETFRRIPLVNRPGQ